MSCSRYETATGEKSEKLANRQELGELTNDLWEIEFYHHKSIEYAFIIRIVKKIGGKAREISISLFFENFGSRNSGC